MTNDEGMTKPEGGDASSSSFVIRHSSFRPGHSSLRRRGRVLERTTFWLFRLATYFVLIAAAVIFLDIGIKGGRTVFRRKRFTSSSSKEKKSRWATVNFASGKRSVPA